MKLYGPNDLKFSKRPTSVNQAINYMHEQTWRELSEEVFDGLGPSNFDIICRIKKTNKSTKDGPITTYCIDEKGQFTLEVWDEALRIGSMEKINSHRRSGMKQFKYSEQPTSMLHAILCMPCQMWQDITDEIFEGREPQEVDVICLIEETNKSTKDGPITTHWIDEDGKFKLEIWDEES